MDYDKLWFLALKLIDIWLHNFGLYLSNITHTLHELLQKLSVS
jgi:hypothetical protein